MTTPPSKKRTGPVSLFEGKVRKPVSITLTPAHHRKVNANMRRLAITRADLIGLLIEKFADSVTKESIDTYKALRDAVATLGGTLEYQKFNGPFGAAWVLTFGSDVLKLRADESKRHPDLDACYKLKSGVATSATWQDRSDEIDPEGMGRLFSSLASTRTISRSVPS